jgi:hypothetical protein
MHCVTRFDSSLCLGHLDAFIAPVCDAEPGHVGLRHDGIQEDRLQIGRQAADAGSAARPGRAGRGEPLRDSRTQGSGTATLSTYSQERQAAPSGAQTLLPTQDKARIERAGTQRWLVVNATPQQVWPVIKDFWQETGFIVNLESPETGVIETDWAENRANIPQDVIRRTIGK